MSGRGPPWSVLGLDPGADTGAIRKAYAAKLKAIDPDADPAGFARLREARDSALRLAKRATVPSETLPSYAEEAPPADAWPDAAPDFDAEAALADRALTEAAWAIDADVFAPPPASNFDPGVPAEVVRDEAQASPPPATPSSPDPHQRLYTLLLGAGDSDATPLDEAELSAAHACLASILRDAAQADLKQHDAIEAWVADTLAAAWPRSAPLLAAAVASFRWDAESGKLGERPAIGFLNARARGYRFQEAVLDRKHIYHKAWIELHRPGPRGLLAGFRTTRRDVDKLLAGIRRNFPELENHLDPERVASWEAPARSRIVLRKAWWIFILLGAAIRVAISLSQPDASPLKQLSPQALMVQQQRQDRAEQTALLVAFGLGHDSVWLERHQPELAQAIRSNARLQIGAGNDDAKVVRIATDLVRQRVFDARDVVKGDLLNRIMRLRLAEMKLAQRAGPAECRAFVQTALLDPAKAALPDALRRREQALAVELAEAGKLAPIERQSPRSATVPGKLVSEVLHLTHLPIERVRAAMQHKASDADDCAVTAALLQATLAYDGEEREAILRTL